MTGEGSSEASGSSEDGSHSSSACGDDAAAHAASSVGRFDAAVATARGLPAATDNDKLRLYGLYKQAMHGDAPASAPWRFDVAAYAKWQAWDALRSLDAPSARLQYVALVEMLAPPPPPPPPREVPRLSSAQYIQHELIL